MMTALHTLFAADHPPTGWTDKEVILYLLGAVGSTLFVMVPIAWKVVYLLAARMAARGDGDPARVKETQDKLDVANTRAATAEATLEQVRIQSAGFEQVVKGLEGEREIKQGELAESATKLETMREELAAAQRRIRKAVAKDGVMWDEKVRADAPEFKPLEPKGRRTSVISFLNLKGGVGKTTATANLGAALVRRGWRVLLIDLDLQSSLTSLFMHDSRHEELYKRKLLIGSFLERAFDGEFPNIHDYAVPVMEGEGQCFLVPTSDDMVYAETNLAVRWYLRDEKRDPRFLLRKELQLKRVTDKFDIVLLDCPPFLNVSCVNALAASDYVVVPVMPSKQSTDRVTILLDRIKEFHDNLNTDLKVMGFFANRTKESSLTQNEQSRLLALEHKCKDSWAAAPRFSAFVRQSTDVRASEDERRPLGPGDELYSSFVKLAEEVEERLPTYCRPAYRKEVGE